MKKLFILPAVFLIASFCQGQSLKDLGRRIANDAESKVEQTASSKMDQGLDSLTTKKVKRKHKRKRHSTLTNTPDSTRVATPVNPTGNNNTPGPTTSGKVSDVQRNNQSNNSAYVKATLNVSVTGPFVKESRKICLSHNGSFSPDRGANWTTNYFLSVRSFRLSVISWKPAFENAVLYT